MSLLTESTESQVAAVVRYSQKVLLADGAYTNVYVVRYLRASVVPRVVKFDELTPLLDWCERQEQAEALVGSFYLRQSGKILGDLWVGGEPVNSVPFPKQWRMARGCLSISGGRPVVGPRSVFPVKPDGDLLQAGPLLTYKGVSVLLDESDPEGFSSAADQFDSDITAGRYPRAAIGLSSTHIYSVVCDGYGNGKQDLNDAGLNLSELAQLMLDLGAQESLNLDGGGSSTQISGGKLRNNPRGDGAQYERGRGILSAIIFELG